MQGAGAILGRGRVHAKPSRQKHSWLSSKKRQEAPRPGATERLAVGLSREETPYDLLVEKITVATV